MTEYLNNSRFRGLVIRRNADDLSDWIDRASHIYAGLGVDIAYKPSILRFPSGAIIRTGHLKDDQSYTKYQGHEYQRILIEELTQIPTEKRYEQLISSCRSTVPDIPAQIFLTTNPGGLGHFWVRNRFIKDRQPNRIYVSPDSGRKQIFIPAKIDDNPVLMNADPDYVKTLDGLRAVDEELWKAWRLGSWDVFVGQAFGDFIPAVHINPDFEMPLANCKKVIGFDWGYSAPGCASWLAFAPENRDGVKHIYQYREIYQNKKTPEEWAHDIKYYLDQEKVDYIVLPHDCFATRVGYPSIADTFKQILGIRIVEGHTLAKGARLNRKALMHQAFSISNDGTPYFTSHPRCKAFNESIPTLVYDDHNIEDIDSESNDHPYDSVTIALLAERGVSGISGSVKSPVPKQPGQRSWTANEDGQFTGPDFVDELKKQMQQRRSTNNAEFR